MQFCLSAEPAGPDCLDDNPNLNIYSTSYKSLTLMHTHFPKCFPLLEDLKIDQPSFIMHQIKLLICCLHSSKTSLRSSPLRAGGSQERKKITPIRSGQSQEDQAEEGTGQSISRVPGSKIYCRRQESGRELKANIKHFKILPKMSSEFRKKNSSLFVVLLQFSASRIQTQDTIAH